MADSALYFPYIEVPDSPTLTRVLLYWDTLGSIVPPDVLHSPRMQRLIDFGLVTSIDPQDYGSNGFRGRHRRDADFDQLVEQYLPTDRTAQHRLRPGSTVQIHSSKGEWQFWKALEARGLARIPTTTQHAHRGWLEVDGHIGALYMALLAAWIGQTAHVAMDPITDQPRYWELLADDLQLGLPQTLDRMRAAMLRNVLPAPTHSIDPGELAEFKADHSTLLRRMRRHVDGELLRCAGEQDPVMRARMVELATRNLEDDAYEIRSRMREKRWPSPTDAICAVLNGIPGLVAGIAVGQPAISATAAIPLAVTIVRSQLSAVELPDSPAVYAVVASERFA